VREVFGGAPAETKTDRMSGVEKGHETARKPLSGSRFTSEHWFPTVGRGVGTGILATGCIEMGSSSVQ
jgi:hypothetical protein